LNAAEHQGVLDYLRVKYANEFQAKQWLMYRVAVTVDEVFGIGMYAMFGVAVHRVGNPQQHLAMCSV